MINLGDFVKFFTGCVCFFSLRRYALIALPFSLRRYALIALPFSLRRYALIALPLAYEGTP